jgi:hypothetical protein
MEYFIIIVAQIFGVLFHTYLKIKQIDDRRDDDTFWEVCNVFYKENILSLILSAVILLFTVFIHFVVGYYTDLNVTFEYYDLIGAGISLILGYQGQKLVYKALDKGSNLVDKKLD